MAILAEHPRNRGNRHRTEGTDVLRVATYRGFAPFAWKDGAQAKGRDIAFLRRFAESRRLSLAVEFFDFDRLWELPARGLADIAAGGISILPGKRNAAVAWTAPYASVRRSLLIRETDTARFRQMPDFKNARLAAVAGSAAHDHALESAPSTASLTFCQTLEHGIAELMTGHIDAVGTGDVSARHHVSERDGLAMIDVHNSRPPEYISFALRATSPLLEELNTFISANAAPFLQNAPYASLRLRTATTAIPLRPSRAQTDGSGTGETFTT